MSSVRDAVRALEARSQSASPSPSRAATPTDPRSASLTPSLPPPTPARFIHPLRSRNALQSPPNEVSTRVHTSRNSNAPVSHDVTRPKAMKGSASTSRPSFDVVSPFNDSDEDEYDETARQSTIGTLRSLETEAETLLDGRSSRARSSYKAPLSDGLPSPPPVSSRRSQFPPLSRPVLWSTPSLPVSPSVLASRPPPPQLTLRPTKSRYPPHVPVPTTNLFAQSALPLFLPYLDSHLSLIAPPVFSPFPHESVGGSGLRKGKGKESASAMFPPMELLQGRMLDDWTHNAVILEPWQNRNIIFSAVKRLSTLLSSLANCPVGSEHSFGYWSKHLSLRWKPSS